MFKLITAALFTLVLSISSVHAGGPSKAIFAGKYDGIAQLENVKGDSIFYSPVRFKITKKGVITGTAYHEDSDKVLKVKGKIGKVTSLFNIQFTGKASGTFSDGTKWTAEIEAQKGVSSKIVRGKARKGVYSGPLSLTNA